jgi:RNA polymerase primary sigma factor
MATPAEILETLQLEEISSQEADSAKILAFEGVRSQLNAGDALSMEQYRADKQFIDNLRRQIKPSVYVSSTEDPVRLYLNEIGRYPLLEKENEKSLAQVLERNRNIIAATQSDNLSVKERRSISRSEQLASNAKELFIQCNLRLVVSIAKRYPLPQSMDLLDLIQEGNVGLEHAVDKFQWQKGFKFSTYSTYWIRQAIGRALDQKGHTIKLPGEKGLQLRSALYAVKGDADSLDSEFAELYRVSTPTSLNMVVGEGESEFTDVYIDGTPSTEEIVISQLDEEEARELLKIIQNPRTRQAVDARFGLTTGDPQTYTNIGKLLGFTGEAARRIVKNGIDEIKVGIW